ncbi:hypothetical protein SCP_0312650 [Sparassis crispa]|uniref:N-acetyltransferase domain-containing protein n=1 Tax=Sparassis crispa TaxID=139825 RepID=A0A401GH64_9APHY|nr:hypothetical protein SCP_0312650 [Sparassis crispa]GBE81536.1 hypothetical protein SCP_0312650 [Sparassis crispa]
MVPKIDEHLVRSLGDETWKAAWNVYSLGTHPDHRKRGVGKALIDVVIQKASEAGKLVTLGVMEEAPVTVELYKGWGFEVRGESIPLTARLGTCYFSLMAKTP